MEHKQKQQETRLRSAAEEPGSAAGGDLSHPSRPEPNMVDAVKVRQLAYGSEEYARSLKLRDEVLRRPLGMNIANDDLSGDVHASHVGAFLDGRLVGILLLRPYREQILQMKQVAVKESLRGLKIGRKLVGYAEEFASEEGGAEIVLHARETAVPFYEKLGYVSEGERFEEIGIPHYVMRKLLAHRVD